MRARTAALILSGVLVIYLGLCVWKGAQAVDDGFHHGGTQSSLLGAGLLIFGFVGSWYLAREIRFGFATDRLAKALADQDALHQHEVDALPRSTAGRIDQSAARHLLNHRRAETEAAPTDWRTWYRLAVAYSTGRDNARARTTMRHAIHLHRTTPPPTALPPTIPPPITPGPSRTPAP